MNYVYGKCFRCGKSLKTAGHLKYWQQDRYCRSCERARKLEANNKMLDEFQKMSSAALMKLLGSMNLSYYVK